MRRLRISTKLRAAVAPRRIFAARFVGGVVVGLAALALLPDSLRSQEAAPSVEPAPATSVHPEARTAINRLWSPYCPGMMLEVCPSPGGEMLRDSIDAMARSGLRADSIVELMLVEYGEEYRAQPRTEGFGGMAWYIPPAAIVAGLIVVGAVLARRRGRRPSVPGVSSPSEGDRLRLEEAMAALDAEERPDF